MKSLLAKVKGALAYTPPEEAEGLLFAGVEKPTTTLAKMIALELLSDKFKPDGDSFRVKNFFLTWRRASMGRGINSFTTIQIQEGCAYVTARGDDIAPRHIGQSPWRKEEAKVLQYLEEKYRKGHPPRRYDISIENRSNHVAFSVHEISIIERALVRGLEFHKQRQALEKEALNQQKAVDVLAAWMDTSPLKVEEPKPAPKAKPYQKDGICLLSPVSS